METSHGRSIFILLASAASIAFSKPRRNGSSSSSWILAVLQSLQGYASDNLPLGTER